MSVSELIRSKTPTLMAMRQHMSCRGLQFAKRNKIVQIDLWSTKGGARIKPCSVDVIIHILQQRNQASTRLMDLLTVHSYLAMGDTIEFTSDYWREHFQLLLPLTIH